MIYKNVETKITFVSIQKIFIYILFFSFFTGIISLGKIGSLSITIPFVVSCFYFIFSLIGIIFNKIHLSKNRFVISIFLICTFVIFCCFSTYKSNYSSLFLYIYFILLFCFVDSRQTLFNFNKVLKLFIIVVTIFSIYGMYQFIAYNFVSNLPLKEIIPQFLWVDDMNIITVTHGFTLFGKELYRAHSIYSEPSTFSQINAIAMLLLIQCNKIFKKRNAFLLFLVNAIGFIVALSGTGLIILCVGLIYFFLKIKLVYKFISIFLLAIILCYLLLDNNNLILDYYFKRANELLFSGSNVNSSGYYRFVLPLKIGFDNLTNNFFGFGIGNDDIAYGLYHANESVITNGFGKIIVETGLIGFIEMIIMFSTMRPNKKSNNYNLEFLLFLIVICLNITGTFLNAGFWSFALLSVVFSNKNIKVSQKNVYRRLGVLQQ